MHGADGLHEVTEADLKGHDELPQSVYPLRNGTAKTVYRAKCGPGWRREGVVSMLQDQAHSWTSAVET